MINASKCATCITARVEHAPHVDPHIQSSRAPELTSSGFSVFGVVNVVLIGIEVRALVVTENWLTAYTVPSPL